MNLIFIINKFACLGVTTYIQLCKKVCIQVFEVKS